MHTNVTVHLSPGDHVAPDVKRFVDGTHIGVLHIDCGDQRLELHATDPNVLYEMAVRIGNLARMLTAARKQSAERASAGCRRALDGEWTPDDSTREMFERMVDSGALD